MIFLLFFCAGRQNKARYQGKRVVAPVITPDEFELYPYPRGPSDLYDKWDFINQIAHLVKCKKDEINVGMDIRQFQCRQLVGVGSDTEIVTLFDNCIYTWYIDEAAAAEKEKILFMYWNSLAHYFMEYINDNNNNNLNIDIEINNNNNNLDIDIEMNNSNNITHSMTQNIRYPMVLNNNNNNNNLDSDIEMNNGN